MFTIFIMASEELRCQLVQRVEQLAFDPDDRKVTVEKYQNLLDNLIRRMREVDDLFDEIFVEVIYTGSYYERLKINHADEFDLNLKLELNFNEDEYHVQHRGVPDGFAMFKLLDDLYQYEDFDADLYSQIFEDGQYLSRVRINRWMQSVIDKSLANGHLPQIRVKRHGAPASTILMKLARNVEVSVDLVPAIYLEHIPRSARKKFLQLPIEKRRSCLVPKPPPKNIADDEALFRISLPELEKEQIQMLGGNFKPIIRIFKSIRDDNGWENDFPSFLFNNFFMWEAEKLSEDYWENTSIEEVFKRECAEFVKTLRKGRIPHYYFPNFNILTVNPEVVNGMANKFWEIYKLDSIHF